MAIPLPCMQPASMHTKALAGHHAQPRSCLLPRAHRTSGGTRRQGRHICHAAKGNGKPAIQGEGTAWMASNCMQSQVWVEALPVEAAMPQLHHPFLQSYPQSWLGPQKCRSLQLPSCAHFEPCIAPHLLQPRAGLGPVAARDAQDPELMLAYAEVASAHQFCSRLGHSPRCTSSSRRHCFQSQCPAHQAWTADPALCRHCSQTLNQLASIPPL